MKKSRLIIQGEPDYFNYDDGKKLNLKFKKTAMNQERFFEVVYWEKWINYSLGFFNATNHKEIADKLQYPNKRVGWERYREIETTGTYYHIIEQGKGGKTFTFEII